MHCFALVIMTAHPFSCDLCDRGCDEFLVFVVGVVVGGGVAPLNIIFMIPDVF